MTADITASGMLADEARYVMRTFTRLPVEFVRGEAWKVWDADGHEYLDFVGGIAVNVLGHAHPAVVKAVSRQAGELIHTSNLYYTRPQVELARKLNQFGFEGRVFFANSGAEANEAAIKLARKWGKENRAGAFEVISAEGSFHGRTLATLAATGQVKYQQGFEPLPEGFRHVPYNDINALRGAVSDRTVAVLLEPIQGESGIIPAEPEYLRAARALCDEQNLLLIFDEIQSGMGRTGSFYAFQGYQVTPDIATLAKGLGGGVPIGACIAAPRADVFQPSNHASTFGGNPLACAAALAVLDTIEREDIIANVRMVGAYLEGGLGQLAAEFEYVEGSRGRGLMQAMLLRKDIAPQLQDMNLQLGLIVNAIGGRVLRLVPPLTIGKEQVDQALRVLGQSLDSLLTSAAGSGRD
jgi:predicted acetylornithine/succinylornithine family transaminase